MYHFPPVPIGKRRSFFRKLVAWCKPAPSPSWKPRLVLGFRSFAEGPCLHFGIWTLVPGNSLSFAQCEVHQPQVCDEGARAPFLVVIGFKMAPWGSLSSPFTGRSHPAGSGSRWPQGSYCLTCYSGRLEGAVFDVYHPDLP